MSSRLTELEQDVEELDLSPDQLEIRNQVQSQIASSEFRLIRATAPVRAEDVRLANVHLADVHLATINFHRPTNCDPELIAKIGDDILGQCEWHGEHLIWIGPAYQAYKSAPSARLKSVQAKGEPTTVVSRIVWQRVYGEIGSDAMVRHPCGESLCQRPDHLEAVLRKVPTYQIEISILQPVTQNREIKAETFEEALATARALPGFVEVLSIRKG